MNKYVKAQIKCDYSKYYNILTRVPSKIIKQKVNDKAWFNEDCVNS